MSEKLSKNFDDYTLSEDENFLLKDGVAVLKAVPDSEEDICENDTCNKCWFDRGESDCGCCIWGCRKDRNDIHWERMSESEIANEKMPKYEYGVYLWGGFFNEEYQPLHGFEEGNYYFDTAEEREKFISELKDISQKHNAKYLMTHEFEGCSCRVPCILHRVTKFEGKEVYSTYDLFNCTSLDIAEYHLENKWFPGCNDNPFGEDFDYDNSDIEVHEWITGAFNEVKYKGVR